MKNESNLSQATVQAWQSALLAVSAEVGLESIYKKINNEDIANIKTISKGLPIFAMIVVIKKDVAHNEGSEHIHELINDWLTTQKNTPAGWCAVNVDSFDDGDRSFVDSVLAEVDTDADRLSEVVVFRYVLCPSCPETLQMSSEHKRTAIAHVIDEQLTSHLKTAIHSNDFDCHILPVEYLLQVHKMACFDMDSTLIEQEVIVELAKATGIGEQVEEITESAMRGEIDFNESFAQRLRLLHGTHADVLTNVNTSLTLSAGAKTTLTLLNAMGYHTVLLSGGFYYFAQCIAEKLSLDEFHANELMIEDGKVIGEAKQPIVDGKRKAELVAKIAHKQGVALSEVICIGDGANDLLMMDLANLGLAYKAKSIVQAKADIAINCTGLEGVLYALGYKSLR